MAREIVIWCDQHLTRDERVTGVTRRVSLGGRETELDLCDQCWGELATPLAALLERAGQPVTKRRRKSKASGDATPEETPGEVHTCDEPGCAREFSSAHGLRMHRQRAHEGKW